MTKIISKKNAARGLACGIVSIMALSALGGSGLKALTVQVDGFTVIGIEARTNNADEMTPNGVIPKQWARFSKENLLEKIPNKVDGTIIAAYTDYESNKDGEYSFIIGAKVTSAESLPNGMIAKQVPARKYVLFTSEKGPVWHVVPNLWKKIWSLPEGQSGSESTRAYLFDYEVYDQRTQDPKNSIVDVYLGVK